MNIFRPIQKEMQETPEYEDAKEELLEKRVKELQDGLKHAPIETQQELTAEERRELLEREIKEKSF